MMNDFSPFVFIAFYGWALGSELSALLESAGWSWSGIKYKHLRVEIAVNLIDSGSESLVGFLF